MTLTVAVADVVPLRMTELGETVQTVAGALSVQATETVPSNPLDPARLSMYVAVCPAVTVAEVPAGAEREKSGVPPVPVNETTCGLPGASLVIVTDPVVAPVDVGVKVTDTTQLAPAPKVAGESGQLLVWTKSPLMEIPAIVKGPLPASVRVTV